MNRFIKASADIVLDTSTRLQWATASIPVDSHTAGVIAAAALDLGGHKGWRLPTIRELLSLVDYDRGRPAIDTDAFPDTKSEWYWSSSPYAGIPDYAWLVNFDSGGSIYLECSDSYGIIRAVRGPVD